MLALAIVLGVMASGVTVLTASRAAFSDTTSNTGNSFSTGTVDLLDDDSGSALFALSNMVPGDSITRCIEVTYQGTVADPGPVRFYSGGYTDSAALATHLDLLVEEGSGGDFGSCAGFAAAATIESDNLVGFDTAHTSYASGAGTWNPSATPDSRTYRITVTLASAAPDSAQGQSVADLVFVWEVQS